MKSRYRVRNLGRYRMLFVPSKKPFRMIGWKDKTKKSFPWYIKTFGNIAETYTKPSILALGMGVGMISDLNDNWSITYVENNKEIIDIAKTHFWIPKEHEIINQDASTYYTKEKFNIIFYDLFQGNEVVREYLTPSYIRKYKSFLKPGGKIIINTVDYPKNLNKYPYDYCYYQYPYFKGLSQNMILVLNT